MLAILHDIGIILFTLLGVCVVAVVGTIIMCPISDFFECRKLYNRVRDISLSCSYWDKETYEQKFNPVECICRNKKFKVEVKEQFSIDGVYTLYVKQIFINDEHVLTVWKSASEFLKHYSYNYITGRDCAEVEEIIKSAQKTSMKLWNERIERINEKRGRNSFFE